MHSDYVVMRLKSMALTLSAFVRQRLQPRLAGTRRLRQSMRRLSSSAAPRSWSRAHSGSNCAELESGSARPRQQTPAARPRICGLRRRKHSSSRSMLSHRATKEIDRFTAVKEIVIRHTPSQSCAKQPWPTIRHLGSANQAARQIMHCQAWPAMPSLQPALQVKALINIKEYGAAVREAGAARQKFRSSQQLAQVTLPRCL